MSDNWREVLIPIDVDGQSVYLAVESTDERRPGEESEISSRRPSLEQALDGLTAIARAMGARLRQSDATRVGVEFGCEFALESGSFVAVVGKASAKSTFKVTLEWSRPPA